MSVVVRIVETPTLKGAVTEEDFCSLNQNMFIIVIILKIKYDNGLQLSTKSDFDYHVKLA